MRAPRPLSGLATLLILAGCGGGGGGGGGSSGGGAAEASQARADRDSIEFVRDALAKYSWAGYEQRRVNNDLVIEYTVAGGEPEGAILERNLRILGLVGASIEGLDDIHVVARASRDAAVRTSARLIDLQALCRGALEAERLADRLEVGFEPSWPSRDRPDAGAVEAALVPLRLTGMAVRESDRNVVVRWEAPFAHPVRHFVDLVGIALAAAPRAGGADEIVLAPSVGGRQAAVLRVRVRDAEDFLAGTLSSSAFYDRLGFNLY